jgi:hypothetical protein
MTTMTLTTTKPAAPRQETATRPHTPCTQAPRMERRWFKVEGKLECRWVEV